MRAFDLTIAICVLIATLPLWLLIALLVKLGDGGPVIFAQERWGFRGRKFHCLKFRTMVVDAEKRLNEVLAHDSFALREWRQHHKIRNDPRITPMGRFLRKLSLDELPQLINIVRGDMSLVGPRPILLSEAEDYGPRLASYFRVRPGITGLWQVRGRSEINFKRRIAFDVVYARSRTIGMDLKILLLTVPAVLLAKGSA